MSLTPYSLIRKLMYLRRPYRLCKPKQNQVFTYDGLLLAAEQFAFVRNVLLVGALGLFGPALAFGFLKRRTLLAVWEAKALLNLWRAATAIGRVSFWLPAEWQKIKDSEISGAGEDGGSFSTTSTFDDGLGSSFMSLRDDE
mmetsp:Transcript_35026/g.79119  ORF Transcript_35026/g.79119 Transcript_35026/m.79119 type:complete len:141 (+) Transcript_35026:784-1206(+)